MESIKDANFFIPTIKDYLETQETCALCGGKLVFKHQTDFYTLSVTEECGCPHCGIKNNPMSYILQ